MSTATEELSPWSASKGNEAAGTGCVPLLLCTSCSWSLARLEVLWAARMDQSHAELTALTLPVEFVQDQRWPGTPALIKSTTLPTLSFGKADISPEFYIQMFSWAAPSSCWLRLWRNKHSGADTFLEETRPCLSKHRD